MKTKFTLTTRLAVSAIAISFIAAASAQNPSLFKKPTPAGSTKAATNAEKTGGSLSAADKKFMMNAAKGGMMEVEMGKMASEKGQSAEVKKIGKVMVADHTKANNELMAIAKSRGVALNENPKMDGWKSDKDYLEMMAKDHEKDLAEFQTEAQKGGDAEVKNFASKTSGVIRKHLSMVKAAQSKMKS